MVEDGSMFEPSYAVLSLHFNTHDYPPPTSSSASPRERAYTPDPEEPTYEIRGKVATGAASAEAIVGDHVQAAERHCGACAYLLCALSWAGEDVNNSNY